MAVSRALIHKLSLSHSYNHQTFKPRLVPFIQSCSRKSELVKLQSLVMEVLEQESLAKDSSNIRATKTIKSTLTKVLSKSPSALFMPEPIEAKLNRMSKWIATAIFMVFLVWKHDVECLWIAKGSVVNYGICLTLKRVLKQERPLLSAKSDPGMPSSHAQSIFYILSTILLSLIGNIGENPFTFTISALGFACASYLSWLRVSQQFHTRSQVIVGGAVGLIFSVIWHWLWHSYVMDAFVWLWWVRATIFFGASTFFLCYFLYIMHHSRLLYWDIMKYD